MELCQRCFGSPHEDCECDLIGYENEDGICWHHVCEGDMREFGCGDIIQGELNVQSSCPSNLSGRV